MMVKSWSLLTAACVVFVLLVPLLISCVVSLVKGNRGDALASLPLVPQQQEVTLPQAGEVIVLLQMPQTASGFGDIQVELKDIQSGHTQTMKYSYLGSQGAVHGFDNVRMPVGRFAAAQAGAFSVQISGLSAGIDYANYRLVFSRPYLGRMAVQIIGIVFCGVGMVGCVIWAAWLAGLMKQHG